MGKLDKIFLTLPPPKMTRNYRNGARPWHKPTIEPGDGKSGMTSKQEKLVRLIEDNVYRARPYSKAQLARLAGYKGRVPYSGEIWKSKPIQRALAGTAERMKKLRDKTILAISRKDLSREKLSDLSTFLKNLNSDIQLLEGKATVNVDMQVKLDSNLEELAGILINKLKESDGYNTTEQRAPIQAPEQESD